MLREQHEDVFSCLRSVYIKQDFIYMRKGIFPPSGLFKEEIYHPEMFALLMNDIKCSSMTQISPRWLSSGLQQPLPLKLHGIPLNCFLAGYESALLEDKQTGCGGTMPGGPENRAWWRKWGGIAEIRRY